MNGLSKLMKDLNVKNFEELKEYIESEEHKDEQLVKEIKEFFKYMEEQDK